MKKNKIYKGNILDSPIMFNKSYLKLSSFYFFYFSTLGAFLPFWPLYLNHINFTPYEIGIITGAMIGTKIIAPNLWGWIADKTGLRHRVIQLGALSCFIIFLFVSSIKSFPDMLLLIFFFSFFWNASLPQFEAVTMNTLGSSYNKYSQIRLWGSFGFIISVISLSVLTNRYGIDIVPICILVFLFLTFSQSAYADWLDIVKDGLESTIEVSQDTWNIAKKTFDEDEDVSEELIPKVQENIEISRNRALAVWDDLVDIFDEIIILKSEKNDAPSISLFGKSKKDYDEKIELIFQTVASLINDPELENDRKTLQILKNKILKSQEESSNLTAKSLLASGKERKELEMALLNATERYSLFKKSFPNLEQKIPQYHIASYLGITQQSLSRLRSEKIKK